MVRFRDVQPLYRNLVLWFALAAALAAVAFALTRVRFRNEDPIVLAIPVLILLWLFAVRLETEVRETGVHLRFRGLWFPKAFSWDRIESAEAVAYRPLLQYGGWGIRRGLGEWAWNVSGSEGVRLHFANGGSFLIGSAQSNRLADAIREGLAAGTGVSRCTL